ncbi:MBL fold metallo-hydrolase [Citricoccus sp. NR2]|uniref:MBL fold metallo-hydrolase n=1 Tax=Citricoccus sp. NR2 TaxID=3004095 RepID=UPI0022DE6320|nr:MBL fold metallo-hydrolase [Citricoccus sp. NR2]WBL18655.1 MBL fold metallo-hydrolase [Citricoccus sp. NR2]
MLPPSTSSPLHITKHGHACISLHRDGRTLVIDPGTFTDLSVALDGAEHVLVTHEHADHLDAAPVLQWLNDHPEATLTAPPAVISALGAASENELSAQLLVAEPGDELERAGFRIRVLGGQHAVIHPQIPVVANLGYLIDERLYHPGDAYVVPELTGLDTLLVPVSAPWARLAETLDFIIAVRPRQVIPIHDALLSGVGRGVYLKQVEAFAQRYGAELTVLTEGEKTWTR